MTTTETIIPDTTATQSDLVKALQASMHILFEEFEQKLVRKDGQALDIRITAQAGSLALEYGISPIK